MNRGTLALLLVLATFHTQAREMSAQEAACLSQIREETDFIISRINLIHRNYEQQLKHSALGKFKSGDYSTIALLDNTIRKYHRRLVRRLKDYPFRYRDKIADAHRSGRKRCLADRLRNESVGTIHKFELSWQKVLHAAEENAGYFQEMEDIH